MDTIHQRIGEQLRQLRQDRGWSLDAAARATGVSKAMLGQIERGESSPTVATLWKIATGFQVSFSSFLEAPLETATVHRLRPAASLEGRDSIHIAPLFPYDPVLGCEYFVIDQAPGYTHLSTPHAAGVVEHVIAVSGDVEVLCDGQWQRVAPGEGVRFAADRDHGYRNSGDVAATFHNLIHYAAR